MWVRLDKTVSIEVFWNETAFEGVSEKQKILPEGEDDSEFPWETTMYCGYCNHVFCFFCWPLNCIKFNGMSEKEF